MELGNWPIKVQLGSTNSKGLPVLFQGSHQGLLLNNHYFYSLQQEPRACPWFLLVPCNSLSCSSYNQTSIPSQLSCCVESSITSIHPIPCNQSNQAEWYTKLPPWAASKPHQSIVVASQAPRRTPTAKAPPCPTSNTGMPVHQWSCPLVNTVANHDGRRKPRSVLRMASIQPIPQGAHTPGGLLFLPNKPMQRRGAWPRERDHGRSRIKDGMYSELMGGQTLPVGIPRSSTQNTNPISTTTSSTPPELLPTL